MGEAPAADATIVAPAPAVLGIGGSLRLGSRTLAAIRVALEGARSAGATTQLVDVGGSGLALFAPDDDPQPDAVLALLDGVRRADALVVGTPVYLATMSGAVKNALDCLDLLIREQPPCLVGKGVGLLCIAGGDAYARALTALESACLGLGAEIIEGAVALGGDAFGEDNEVIDWDAREQLLTLGRAVGERAAIRWGSRLPGA